MVIPLQSILTALLSLERLHFRNITLKIQKCKRPMSNNVSSRKQSDSIKENKVGKQE